MELPFAVTEDPNDGLPAATNASNVQSNIPGNINGDNVLDDAVSASSSLVTASSQGSFIDSDVDLIPIYVGGQHEQQHQSHQHGANASAGTRTHTAPASSNGHHPQVPIVGIPTNVHMTPQVPPSYIHGSQQQHHHHHPSHPRQQHQRQQQHQQQHQQQQHPIISDAAFVDADFAYIDIPTAPSAQTTHTTHTAQQPHGQAAGIPRPPRQYQTHVSHPTNRAMGPGMPSVRAMPPKPAPTAFATSIANNPPGFIADIGVHDTVDHASFDVFVDAEPDHLNIDDDEDYEYGRATAFQSAIHEGATGDTNRGDVLALLLSNAVSQNSQSDPHKRSSGSGSNTHNSVLTQNLQDASSASLQATEAKQNGQLGEALSQHAKSAKLYRDCAVGVQTINPQLSNSLLLLSQTQAKSAIALKRIMRLNTAGIERLISSTPSSSSKSNSSAASKANASTSATRQSGSSANTNANGPASSSRAAPSSTSAARSNAAGPSDANSIPLGNPTTSTDGTVTKEERLRAVVRGALGSGHPREEDISESMFLGRASSSPSPSASSPTVPGTGKSSSTFTSGNRRPSKGSLIPGGVSPDNLANEARNGSGAGAAGQNPIDQMMELEQELRDMDMTLGLGQSISSLDTRMQYANQAHAALGTGGNAGSNKLSKNTTIDGSFMVVTPGSQSYMSSSAMWGGSSSIHMAPISSAQPGQRAVSTMGPGVGAYGRNGMAQPTQVAGSRSAGVRARANRLQNLTTSRVLSTGAIGNNSNSNLAGLHQQQQQHAAGSHSNANASHQHHSAATQTQQQSVKSPSIAADGVDARSSSQMDSAARTDGLESSWWGGPPPGSMTMAASQVLANSVLSIGSRAGTAGSGAILVGGHHTSASAGMNATNTAGNSTMASDASTTKQVLRLMDALKTLGDENATLMRQVEDAQSARAEAKAAKEQMKRFKAEFTNRFAVLSKSLEKYRKQAAAAAVVSTVKEDGSDGDPQSKTHEASAGTESKAISRNKPTSDNLVLTSDYMTGMAAKEQVQRQEQLIRKLKNDLKAEKEQSRKKAAALRKYEDFYREVKARSAQKNAVRQEKLQKARKTAVAPASHTPADQHVRP